MRTEKNKDGLNDNATGTSRSTIGVIYFIIVFVVISKMQEFTMNFMFVVLAFRLTSSTVKNQSLRDFKRYLSFPFYSETKFTNYSSPTSRMQICEIKVNKNGARWICAKLTIMSTFKVILVPLFLNLKSFSTIIGCFSFVPEYYYSSIFLAYCNQTFTT